MNQFEINIKDEFFKESCIYIIRNKNNNKIYIGSTINFRKRSLEHKRDLEKNNHRNKHLQKSYNKGNKFTIEILEICQKEELILLETDYVLIHESNNKNIGYNILIPGDNSPSIDKVDPELGYIKGNIRVISFKANRMKQDNTKEQLEKLLLYIEGKI